MNDHPEIVARREELRMDNARIHAIIAMEHLVSLNKARLLFSYMDPKDPVQKHAIQKLMVALLDAKVNEEILEVSKCLKELTP